MTDKESYVQKFSAGKKICCVTGLLLMSMVFLSENVSAGTNLDVFLGKCGSCHKKGAEAAPVNPADKAALVWEKYFKRNRHPVDLSSTMTDDEKAQALGFLKHHAADSDHPVAAVIPK